MVCNNQGEITRFFASKDYEVAAIFTSGGELISVNTDYNSDSVSRRGELMSIYQWQKEHSRSKASFTDFHNHPISDDLGTRLFSENDVHNYAQRAANFAKGQASPSKFTVLTQDGHEYTLKYGGGGRRKPENFGRAYKKRMQAAQNVWRSAVSEYYLNHNGKEMPKQEALKVWDGYMSKWLKGNAKQYGFEYTEM